MHLSLVGLRLVRWIGALSLAILISDRSHGQVEVQTWLDSLSQIAESYETLAVRVAAERAATVERAASMVMPELDVQPEGIRIACLANRLLAEEYLPYDFDIRETMWCKGISARSGSTFIDHSQPSGAWSIPASEISETEVVNSPSIPYGSEKAWYQRIQKSVWDGFVARLRNDWMTVSSRAKHIAVRIQSISATIERQRLANQLTSQVAGAQSLRETFGSHIVPNEISITASEQATLAIQSWDQLRLLSASSGILPKSTWYQFQPSQLEPTRDLVTATPSPVSLTQR